MSAYTDPSRLGAINDATSTEAASRAIMLEVFSGLVLKAFDRKTVTSGHVTTKHIKSGKTAQFPLTWKNTAAYHAPGAEIQGNAIYHAKKNIAIEQLLIAPVFVDVLDEALNHYETRSEYAKQNGEALAVLFDQNNFRAIFIGATQSNLITAAGAPSGQPIQAATVSTVGTVARAACYDAAQYFDEADVPETDRMIVVNPPMYYTLLEDGEFINTDWRGEGSKARANMPFASDMQVIKSNNIPTDDELTTPPTNVPDVLNDQDMSAYVGAAFHPLGVGVVELMGLSSEVEYSARHQGNLILSKRALGQDWLRPECCISIEDKAPA